MEIYQMNLAGLLALCAALFVAQRNSSTSAESKPEEKDEKSKAAAAATSQAREAAKASQRAFLIVYALVMGADWLQGPFLYSLYTDEHKVAPSTVSTLFTTGFVSGAVSGTFVGSLADSRGRKAVCMLFCLLYSGSCLLTILPGGSLPLLFLGRVLGGVSTSILFSVFETWMVADANWRGAAAGGDLSRVFGLMSTTNSVVAIASGVLSEWLVDAAGTRKAPFAASVVLLLTALWVIMVNFRENYGEAAASPADKDADASKSASGGGGGKTLKDVLTDPQILSLGLAGTIFEGSMYLFVFYWTPALKSAAAAASASSAADLPYGIIFASFMAAVLAASLAFNLVMGRGLVRYSSLLLGLMVASHLVFFVLAREPQPKQPEDGGSGSSGSTEQRTFWLFCAFEACVGAYWPCMGYLKGRLVGDAVRGRVYGLMRIPLNLFVVAALLVSSSSSGAHGAVFKVCSSLLLGASGALMAMVLNQEGLP
ncbi:uncharacterized protein E0L32_011475 [Thyridium curvatum]|uniref:Molybdate-anion transporter n=1 Tax=Thyridium curvatum TaxID=1093900 RepID=A0A507BPZ9_9PEZI|nr:uncharacterized protein E0L32_011475 [Thyridium curvatum]TPX18860.1 hypothetical protein E0L32_011475 [Thyridium curvatum]